MCKRIFLNARLLREHEESYAHSKAMVEAGLAQPEDAANRLLWVRRQLREIEGNAPRTPPPSGGGMSVWGSEGKGSRASHNGTLPSQRARKPRPPEIRVPLGVDITWDDGDAASVASSSSSSRTARADWRRQQLSRGADYGAALLEAEGGPRHANPPRRWRAGDQASAGDGRGAAVLTPHRPPTADSLLHAIGHDEGDGCLGAEVRRVGVDDDVQRAQQLGQYWLTIIKTALAEHVEPGAAAPFALRPRSGVRMQLGPVGLDVSQGIRFRVVDMEEAIFGEPIHNALLARELQQGVTEFSREELEALEAADLAAGAFIKVGDLFFKPVLDAPEDPLASTPPPGGKAEEEEEEEMKEEEEEEVGGEKKRESDALARLKRRTERKLLQHLGRTWHEGENEVLSDMRDVGWLWKKNHDSSGEGGGDWRDRLCFIALDSLGYYSEQRGCPEHLCKLTHIQNVKRVSYPAAGHEHCFEIDFMPPSKQQVSQQVEQVSQQASFAIKGQVRESLVFACSSAADVSKWMLDIVRAYKYRAGFLRFMKDRFVLLKQEHPDAGDDHIERLLHKEFRAKDAQEQRGYEERAVHVEFSGLQGGTEEHGDAAVSTGDGAGDAEGREQQHLSISFTHQLQDIDDSEARPGADSPPAPQQPERATSKEALTTRQLFLKTQERLGRVAAPDAPPLPWMASIDAPVLGSALLLCHHLRASLPVCESTWPHRDLA